MRSCVIAALKSASGTSWPSCKLVDETLMTVSQSTLFGKAFALQQNGQLAQAQAIYEDVLKAQPEHADALHLLGIVTFQLGDPQRAIALIGKATQLHPNNADYHCNLGIVLAAIGQSGPASARYDEAISIRPEFAEAYNNRGLLQADSGRLDDAIESYDKALEIKPNFASAYSNRGIVLAERGQLEAAVADYEKAISISPNYAEAHSNLGIAQAKLGQPEAAVDSYDRAIALKPDYADAFYNRGNALKQLKKIDAAVLSYKKALETNPGFPFLLGMLLHTKMEICDWTEMETYVEKLISQIENYNEVSPPLDIQRLCDNPVLHKAAAEIWMRAKHPLNLALGPISKRPKSQRIRIGYYSADFRNHAVAQLAVEIFEFHDRKKFELVAFSFRSDAQDSMRTRVESAFNKFVDVTNKSDREVAELSRELEIDIAIDLGGFTAGNRPGIFSFRAAPIQVGYLGYSGTMAAEYYDYIIADQMLIPQESQIHYSEKIVYIPTRQVAALDRGVVEMGVQRKRLGLPDSKFVFCCFNNHIKITPATFHGWMRILRAVEDSVLFLNIGNDLAKSNIKNEAVRCGIDPARIIFKGFLSTSDYLGLYSAVDLFLDTYPYTAATTASDACWAGLPVLTLMGESYASRMAASVLNALELPELIVRTQEAYESKAIELATDPAQLLEIRTKVQKNKFLSPVFNSKFVTKHIEAAYIEMYERYHAELPPDHIAAVPS